MTRTWRIRGREVTLTRPLLMGIVNVTPDSFSDGGRYADADAAVAHAKRLVAEGADLLDVGGESTRPGADPVPEAVELARVVPVIEALAREVDVPLSIDTMKSGVAEAALAAGAHVVNDVSGGTFDPRVLRVARDAGAGLVLMHMKGEPRTMQQRPEYGDVVAEVSEHLRAKAAAAEAAGVPRDAIMLDPGIGFGKTLDHNLALLRATPELRKLGYPLLVGVSRKSFLGALTTRPSGEAPPPRDRVEASVAMALYAAERGADVLRVHDVLPHWRALRVANALAGVP